MTLRSITLFLTLAWTGTAAATPPGGSPPGRFALPDFKSLQGQAIDSVDVTLGPWMLRSASSFLDDSDPDSAVLKKVLAGITSIRVRSLSFDHDLAYGDSDLEAVREQLSGPNWLPILSERSHKDGERVDIRLRVEDAQARGFALIATQPREFTIVYVAGFLNPADLPRLMHGLHLPAVDADAVR
jgi:hypothetical protein